MPIARSDQRRVRDLSWLGLFLIVFAATALAVGVMLAVDAFLASVLTLSVGAVSLTLSPLVLVGVAGASAIPATIGSLLITVH